eukprot:scaffold4485_cov135-Isochrysis_galbana.AAC.12
MAYVDCTSEILARHRQQQRVGYSLCALGLHFHSLRGLGCYDREHLRAADQQVPRGGRPLRHRCVGQHFRRKDQLEVVLLGRDTHIGGLHIGVDLCGARAEGREGT